LFLATNQENNKNMTLQEASNFFENLKNETSKKSEIKIYKKILDILTGLKNRDFSKDEIQTIETELESIGLKSNRANNIKFFKKALNKFELFLKDTFSLTSKGYYTNLGSVLGGGFGILFGVVFLSSWEQSLGISMGLIFGSAIGMFIGESMDAQAMSEGRMI
jgi:hypothetical protein